jgi:hypothetical protein
MTEKPKLVPPLIGGLFLGLISAIPVMNFGNICSLWILAGGVVSVYMVTYLYPAFPISSGGGAVSGFLAGVFGSLVYLIVGVPIIYLRVGEMGPVLHQMGRWVNDPALRDWDLRRGYGSIRPLEAVLMVWLIRSVLFVGFGTLGGLLGAALFGKRKANPDGRR